MARSWNMVGSRPSQRWNSAAFDAEPRRVPRRQFGLSARRRSAWLQAARSRPLGFGWRPVSDWLEQATVVEPVDPFKRGELDGLERAPRPASVDDLGLEEAVDGLGERVIVAVADTAHGWFDARLSEPLGVADRDILGRFK